MMRHNCLFPAAVLIAVCFFSVGLPALATPPVLDLDNITAYRIALEHATEPESKAILLEIANGPAGLAKAETAAKKAGILLTAPTPPKLHGPNAADLYAKWYSLYNQPGSNYPPYAQPMTLAYNYTTEQIATVSKIVDSHKAEDVLLMKAITCPFRMPAETQPGSGPPPTYLLRDAARQIRTESMLLALRGEQRSAVLLQLKGFEMLRQAKVDDSIVGTAMANSVEINTIRGIDDILEHSNPNEPVDQLITSTLSCASRHRSLRAEFQGEPASQFGPLTMDRFIFDTAVVGPETNKARGVISAADLKFFHAILEVSLSRYLNSTRRAVDCADEPPMRRRVALEKLDAECAALLKRADNDPVNQLGIPVNYHALAKHDDEISAWEQVTLAAAAVLSVRAHAGRFPRSLPGRFPDPFSGKQLVYRTTNNGFLVYSVGPTGHFDGNMKHGEVGWESEFQYPAPPPVPVPQDLLQ